MNKAMLVIGAATALIGGAAFAQAPADPNSIGVGPNTTPLQGDAAVDQAQKEGASPGAMGPIPTPSTASPSTSSSTTRRTGASSAGQYGADTAAQAPSVDKKKKPDAKSDDRAGASSSMSSGATSGSTGAGASGSTGY